MPAWPWELWFEKWGWRPLHTAPYEYMELDEAPRGKKVRLFNYQILFLFPGNCHWALPVTAAHSGRSSEREMETIVFTLQDKLLALEKLACPRWAGVSWVSEGRTDSENCILFKYLGWNPFSFPVCWAHRNVTCGGGMILHKVGDTCLTLGHEQSLH